MSVLGLFLLIALIGLVVWLLTTYVPMDQRIKNLLVVAAVIIVVLIILQATGLLSGGLGQVPRLAR